MNCELSLLQCGALHCGENIMHCGENPVQLTKYNTVHQCKKSATQCSSSNTTLSLIECKCWSNRPTQKRKLPNGRVTKNNVQWRKYCPLDKILFSGGNTVQQSSTSGQMEEQLLPVPLRGSTFERINLWEDQSLKSLKNLFLLLSHSLGSLLFHLWELELAPKLGASAISIGD